MIPDANFRAALKAKYPACFNASDMMDTTCSGIVNARQLTVSDKSILSLQGIQYFKNLRGLNCSNNQLNALPQLPGSLDYLNFTNNFITVAPPLPAALKALYCSNNLLTGFPALPSTLEELYCFNNRITFLPALPDTLR